jgi:hypothetical protein
MDPHSVPLKLVDYFIHAARSEGPTEIADVLVEEAMGNEDHLLAAFVIESLKEYLQLLAIHRAPRRATRPCVKHAPEDTAGDRAVLPANEGHHARSIAEPRR